MLTFCLCQEFNFLFISNQEFKKCILTSLHILIFPYSRYSFFSLFEKDQIIKDAQLVTLNITLHYIVVLEQHYKTFNRQLKIENKSC